MKNIINADFGHCHYCICYKKNCAMIYNLFIKKDYRRKGNAKIFVQNAIDKIRETGYTRDIKIIAEPEAESISKKDLIKFYEKMGLKVVNYK